MKGFECENRDECEVYLVYSGHDSFIHEVIYGEPGTVPGAGHAVMTKMLRASAALKPLS